MPSFNTYVSAKRVQQFPDDAQRIAAGEIGEGMPFVAGIDANEPAALLITAVAPNGEPVRLRLGFTRLIRSLIGAEAAAEDRWEPVVPGDREGWYGNSILSAHVQQHDGVIQISYHRHDRAPIRDWRIGQRLKNQLAGPEWEGVEIYPAESRLVDTCNEYHLFCVKTPLPLGFDYREVATQDQLDEVSPNAVQRDDPDADTSDFDPTLEVLPVRTPAREFIHIGWITDAIQDEDDLENFMAHQRNDVSLLVDPLDEYTGEEEIHHSHGPVTKPIPVYIPQP